DEDYYDEEDVVEVEEDEGEEEAAFSNSEDERDSDEEKVPEADGDQYGVAEEDKKRDHDGLVHSEADESDNEGSEYETEGLEFTRQDVMPETAGVDLAFDGASEDEAAPMVAPRGKRRTRQVIADEEDEDEGLPAKPASQTQSTPDPMAAFGFEPKKASPIGLTQMFAGTMADLQSQDDADDAAIDTQQDSIAFLQQLPPATIPEFDSYVVDESQPQDMLVKDSQMSHADRAPETQTQVKFNLAQLESQHRTPFETPSKFSDIPDPTQDVGFGSVTAPHSTADTVLLPIPESPLVMKKKGRLRQRNEGVQIASDIDEHVDAEAVQSDADDEFAISANAFDALKRGSNKAKKAENYDKKKSAAKDMFEEAAEESEDEHAGLGGASDDESTGEIDEEVEKMIDRGAVNVDERAIAAFHA
ncbi:hypothetical protein LTS18_014952, partial [Coniosporium uncinatum]